jgi:hypothetical protein
MLQVSTSSATICLAVQLRVCAMQYENIQAHHICGFSLAKEIIAIRRLRFIFSPQTRSKLTPSDEGGDGRLNIVDYGPKNLKADVEKKETNRLCNQES